MEQDFITRLRELMREREIANKRALERATGIKYSRLNEWFRPDRRAAPNAHDTHTLAKHFNVSEEWLLHGGERQPYDPRRSLDARFATLNATGQERLKSYLAYLEETHPASPGESNTQ